MDEEKLEVYREFAGIMSDICFNKKKQGEREAFKQFEDLIRKVHKRGWFLIIDAKEIKHGYEIDYEVSIAELSLGKIKTIVAPSIQKAIETLHGDMNGPYVAEF